MFNNIIETLGYTFDTQYQNVGLHDKTNLTIRFFFVTLRPNAGHGLLILEVSRSHTTTYQSVGLLWTSDQLVAETST